MQGLINIGPALKETFYLKVFSMGQHMVGAGTECFLRMKPPN